MADLNEKLEELNNTKDTTAEYDPADIEANKVMGILAYLSWLVIVPLIGANKSKFARFHCNQGLVLAISEIVVLVFIKILSRLPLIGWLIAIVGDLVGLVCIIMALLGIVNAASGKAKELPIIGSFKFLK